MGNSLNTRFGSVKQIANRLNTFRERWSTATDYLIKICGFIFVSIILLFLDLFITPSILLPGTIFRLPVLVALLSAPFIISYIFFSLPSRKGEPQASAKKQISNKAVVIVFGIFVVASLFYLAYGNISKSQHLKSAKQEFTVVQADPISEERIDTTLVELDSQFSRLNNEYGPVPRPDGMKIVMFATVQSLQMKTKIQQWADAYFTFVSGQPEIDIPAEQANDSGSNNGIVSPVPGHEIAHFVIYEIVGAEHYNQIPLWFNEGLAQYESLKGFEYTKIEARSGTSLGLWLYNISNPSLLGDSKFLLHSKTYPTHDIDVFYAGSLEFVRYIDSHYGHIGNILHLIAGGEDFSSAFKQAVGKDYEQVYLDWHHAFFGD